MFTDFLPKSLLFFQDSEIIFSHMVVRAVCVCGPGLRRLEGSGSLT